MDLSQKNDSELIMAYRSGAREAFSILLDRHLPTLYRFAVRYIGSPDEAQDIVQEACVKAWKRLATFDVQKRFLPWIFSIIKNTAIDTLRRKTPLTFAECFADDESEKNFAEEIPDEQSLPPILLERQEIRSELEKILAKLPRQERTILLMHYYDSLSLSEISELLAIPLNTVKSHRFRALTKLREFFATQSAPVLP